MSKITKTGLIDLLSAKNGKTKKDTSDSLAAFLDVVQEQLLLGNDVELKDIGTLRIVAQEARTGRNPASGEPMAIPAKKVLRFKASSVVSKAIND
jgi:DNA-binding protein HU-beta